MGLKINGILDPAKIHTRSPFQSDWAPIPSKSSLRAKQTVSAIGVAKATGKIIPVLLDRVSHFFGGFCKGK